ncbi:MAG: FCD domain-containing protein [Micrococcales bacterium]|nr:FCD domain-containing protein [Micrococcales bacterium]
MAESIELGLLADGEQLPVEVDFAQQLGVSPMTLREGLAILRQDGLVETRRGRKGGTFVRRPSVLPVERAAQRLAGRSVSSLRDLADEQAAVSGQAAKLAAERATSSAVRQLLRLVEQLESAGDAGARLRADSRFHIQIAMASQSERLTRREVALQGECAALLWLPPQMPIDIHRVTQEHHDIVTAVAEEDGEMARTLAERHVQRNLRMLTDWRLKAAPRRNRND